ncbi:MAG TPA: hypothetical protein VLA36_05175, partial [Longimicrobiales bacterium]|nr:hypothetical protein [Longimicrobiales bacterium]
DEFERAISGSPRKKGMSALGWLFMSLGLFVVLGVVGVGFAMNRVAHKVEEMLVGFDYDAGAAASKVVARLESHAQLLSAAPDQGLEFLRKLDGHDPAEAFLGNLFGESFGGNGPFADLADLADLSDLEQVREPRSGSLPAHEGDVSIDLNRVGEGGSLVIRSDDGTVRLDLRRTDDGGSLVIDSDQGQARIALQRTDHGGYLTVDSDEGSIRFDLIRSGEGGRLLVETDGGESLRLGFGEDAEALPGWVPRLDGMPERPRPVYSLSADQGTLGAVAWTQDTAAQAALDAFQSQLEDARYEIRAEHHRDGADFDEGSLWAKNEESGRLVFVVAHETDEGTKLLVGYGEETR